VPLISKVFSILFPGLIVGLLNVQAVTDSTGAFIIVAYVSSKSFVKGGSTLLTQISVLKSVCWRHSSHLDFV